MDKTTALTVDRRKGDGANGTAATDITRLRAQINMGSDGERVIQWLTEQVALHSDTRPMVIYLHHVTPSRKMGDKLGTLQLKLLASEQLAADAMPEMAHSVWSKSESYAAGLGGGAQQFALRSYYEDDPSESESATYFWIRNAQTRAEREIDSLPASENGVLRLVMGKLDRLEDSFCDLMEGSSMMMRVMREQLNDLHQQAIAERQERRAGEEEVRKAKLAELDRAAAREAAKADQEMKRELGATVKTVGLAIARKWGGLDVRDVVSPGNQQLMMTFESLAKDEGRFMDILERLKPAERANFMEWWQAQIDAAERLRQTAQPASSTAPAAPTAQPAAQPAAPAAQPTAAEQAAIARKQAEEWAAIAAALEAQAQPAAPVVPPTQAQPAAEAAPPAPAAEAAPTPVAPEPTVPVAPKAKAKKRKE